MHSRLTPWVVLDLSPRQPGEYADSRLRSLAVASQARYASCWANAHPDRDDLPRTLGGAGDFLSLGVYEFERPPFAPPGMQEEDGAMLTFRRYPRPAQGRLTGQATTGLLIVLIHPREGRGAQELRDWSDFVHLRHIAEATVPGYTVMTPYERAEHQEDLGGPRYLHVYEMDTDDPETAFKSMRPRVARLLGGEDTEAFAQWAQHPQLRIDYVNTFRLVTHAG